MLCAAWHPCAAAATAPEPGVEAVQLVVPSWSGHSRPYDSPVGRSRGQSDCFESESLPATPGPGGLLLLPQLGAIWLRRQGCRAASISDEMVKLAETWLADLRWRLWWGPEFAPQVQDMPDRLQRPQGAQAGRGERCR